MLQGSHDSSEAETTNQLCELASQDVGGCKSLWLVEAEPDTSAPEQGREQNCQPRRHAGLLPGKTPRMPISSRPSAVADPEEDELKGCGECAWSQKQ